MIRSAVAVALLLITSTASVQAGLSVVPQAAPILPGTTVVFDLNFENTDVAPVELAAIGNISGDPFLLSVAATTGTGTPPSFTSSGVPTATSPWVFDTVIPEFFTLPLGDPPVSVPASGSETFASLSVDIPSNFQGGFELAVVNEIAFIGPASAGSPVHATTAAGTAFGFTAVPEPNAFVFLALVGSVFAGAKYVRKRFA